MRCRWPKRIFVSSTSKCCEGKRERCCRNRGARPSRSLRSASRRTDGSDSTHRLAPQGDCCGLLGGTPTAAVETTTLPICNCIDPAKRRSLGITKCQSRFRNRARFVRERSRPAVLCRDEFAEVFTLVWCHLFGAPTSDPARFSVLQSSAGPEVGAPRLRHQLSQHVN